MTGKKIKHVMIPEESLRKSSLERRMGSLFKKANELSILCGIEICILVLKSGDDGDNVTAWPSPERARETFTKFLNFPETLRMKKMTEHESFLDGRLCNDVKTMEKNERKNNEKEIKQIVNQIIKGRNLDSIDLSQLDWLYLYAGEQLKMLEKRRQELEAQHHKDGDKNVIEEEAQIIEPNLSSDDKWFSEIIMFEDENNMNNVMDSRK